MEMRKVQRTNESYNMAERNILTYKTLSQNASASHFPFRIHYFSI